MKISFFFVSECMKDGIMLITTEIENKYLLVRYKSLNMSFLASITAAGIKFE